MRFLWLPLLLAIACLPGHAAIEKCGRFVLAFSGLIQQTDVTSTSPLFKSGAVTDPSRVIEIYYQMQSSYSPMGLAVADYLKSRTDAEVRALRAGLVDLFNVLDGDYQTLLHKTDQALAGAERVAELGCGSGMFCAYLSMEAAQRHIIAVDHEPVILQAVAERMAMTPNSVSTIESRNVGFSELEIEPASLDGAVLSLTLFHLPYEKKVALLKKIHHWLKPGGRLVLNDWVIPHQWSTRDETGHRLHTMVEEGHPISEFQYALWVGIHAGAFYQRLGPDYPENSEPLYVNELPVLLRQNGFEAGEAEMVGVSGIAMVVATKGKAQP